MLVTIQNEDNFVIAYADYRIVDKDGKEQKDGEYAYVKHCWIHSKHERKGILEEIVKSEHKKNPQVKWIYYRRRKYGGKIKMYPIERFYE